MKKENNGWLILAEIEIKDYSGKYAWLEYYNGATEVMRIPSNPTSWFYSNVYRINLIEKPEK